MKYLVLLSYITCVLMVAPAIAAAHDDAPEEVITMIEPVGAEAACSEYQTMPAPDASAPVCQVQRAWVGLIFFFFWLAFFLVISIIGAFLWCRIYSKIGYGWAFGLLMIVPVANFVMLCVLAFSEWPILKEVKSLRQQVQQRPPASV